MVGLSAVAPDDTVVVTGNARVLGQPINIDSGRRNAPGQPGNGGARKVRSPGQLPLGQEVRHDARGPRLGFAAWGGRRRGGAANGNIIVVGAANELAATAYMAPVIYTFGADGGVRRHIGEVVPAAIAVLPPTFPAESDVTSFMLPTGRLAVDSHNGTSCSLTVRCGAPATFGPFSFARADLVTLTSPGYLNVCIVKVSPQGAVQWAKTVEGGATSPFSLVVDANDDIISVSTAHVKSLQKIVRRHRRSDLVEGQYLPFWCSRLPSGRCRPERQRVCERGLQIGRHARDAAVSDILRRFSEGTSQSSRGRHRSSSSTTRTASFNG